MNPDVTVKFPKGREFLEFNNEILKQCSAATDAFMSDGGECLRTSIDGLGTVLSLLYQGASCWWGCQGGDHQIEWLCGRIVNQALASYELIRNAFYDESLMLTRGIGEISNLVLLFDSDVNELQDWKSSTRRQRMDKFGPKKVRDKLAISSVPDGVPIEDDRYRELCEVGTHPVPRQKPGHFNSSGKPILGGILQDAGVFVCVNELSIAVAISAIPFSKLLGLKKDNSLVFKSEAVKLIESLGAFDIMNYNELLAMARPMEDSFVI